MAPRTLPGLGLNGFWTLGEDNWKDANDINLRTLSALVQCRVISRTTVLPGSPTDGDMYIVPLDEISNADEIAIRDNGAWVYLVPAEGYIVYVTDQKSYVRWDGTVWSNIGGTGRTFTGAADTAVLADANNIVVGNSATAQSATIPPNTDVPLPVWTVLTYVQRGAGLLTLVAGAAVTLNPAPGFTLVSAGQYAVLSAVQIAADIWVVTGQLEPTP